MSDETSTRHPFPLISIIVPVYKVEPYLRKCIDSILCQSYYNMEIILIDDGSPDGCGVICDEYMKKDDRVKVIHKNNGGSSSARNAGIDISSGEFLFFLDGDDYIAVDCINSLNSNMLKYKSDCAVTNAMCLYENRRSVRSHSKCDEVYILSRIDAMNTMLYHDKMDFSVWGKLFKRNLFGDDIRFPDGKIYEDLDIMYRVISKCNTVTISNEIHYFYHVIADSMHHRRFNSKQLDLIEVAERMLQYMKENFPQCYSAAVCMLVSSYFRLYCRIPGNDSAYRKHRAYIQETIKKYRRSILSDKDARSKTKYACLLSYFGFSTVKILLHLSSCVQNK